jgi:hypothetical protein
MAKKTLKYKDTTVAQGSQLYEALEAGDHKLAEKIWQECEKEFYKYWPKTAFSFDYRAVSVIQGPDGNPEFTMSGYGQVG